MSWIEGIGDEVPIFFFLAVAVVVIFMVLAWKSTNVPEPSTPLSEDQLRYSVASDGTPEVAADPFAEPSNQPPSSNSSAEAQVVSPSTLDSEQPVEHPKDDNNPTENEENREEGASRDEEQDDTGTKIRRRILETTQAQELILIRLKYLDDTQRVVESSMNTTLGDFKRVHFRAELSANKTIKLIYNGQVLTSESQTLTQLGLDNNCVVHCLIHQSRTNSSTASGSQETNEPNAANTPNVNTTQQVPQAQRSNESSPAEAGVDIGGLLVPLFAVVLGLVWYCRIAYATHFTAAATTALVGLSGICILFVFAVWHPTLTVEQTP